MNKRWLVLIVMVVAMVLLTVACASGSGNDSTEQGQGSNEPVTGSGGTEEAAGSEEVVDLEVWTVNQGFQAVEAGSPLYERFVDLMGVGIVQPYVEWNGGSTYVDQLNMRIAAGEMPDLFLPHNGLEYDLARNGAIEDLTDLLPEHAPNMWNLIPEEVWNNVRANDPTGQGRIYYVPNIRDYEVTGGQIRQDWLDNLGLPMPTTQEEYVNVLRAFKNDDPNGNGLQDEIPTSGRENARWMDHLFAMYGIAMYEGFPEWDIYDGEITYSAVTPNMRDALQFIAEIYAEGLLDQETFLNDQIAWNGKINSGLVGNHFHWTETVFNRLPNIVAATGEDAEFSVLPIPEVPGYEGFYTYKPTQPPLWVVRSGMDEETLMAAMTFLDKYADQDLWVEYFYGVEGMHHEVVDGKRKPLPQDKSSQQNPDMINPHKKFGILDFNTDFYLETASEELLPYVEQGVRNMREAQQYMRAIAGDGMPVSLFDDYPDIRSASLYQEYATKIIIGEYSIDKFDEFVERWHQSGGDVVTERVREWYEDKN